MNYKKIIVSPEEVQTGEYKKYFGGGGEFWEQRGQFQLLLLQRLGLKPEHSLLDVGCGPLRGGVHFIRHIGEKYRGVDVNADFIDIAHKVLECDGLSAYKENISRIRKFDFSKLETTFDFILCFSVLNHCSSEDRKIFFENVKKVMHKDSKLIISHGWWLSDYKIDNNAYVIDEHVNMGSSLLHTDEIQSAGFEGKAFFPVFKMALSQQYMAQLDKRIFICGCGHSGTSLILAVLSNHSQAFGVKIETNCFGKEEKNNRNLAFYEHQAIEHKKSIFVEKTPRHVYKIQHVLDTVENAKIVIILRNPLDVIASFKKRYSNFNRGLSRYINDSKACIPHIRNENVHFFKYEDFVKNPEAEVRKICEFADIEFEPSMLEFYKKKDNYFRQVIAEETDGRGSAKHAILRNWQMRQPISDKSGEWRTRITSEEYEFIKARTWDIANTLGYTFAEPYMLPVSS